MMPKKKTKKTAVATEPETATPEVRYYRHPFVNCHLTLNPKAVAAGEKSISIILRKNKEDAHGVFDTANVHIQKLISEYPWLDKPQLVEITKEQAFKLLKKPKPEEYHRGVVSALMGKAKR